MLTGNQRDLAPPAGQVRHYLGQQNWEGGHFCQNTLPAQQHCTHSAAFAAIRNGVHAPVACTDVGSLLVVFVPLHFPIFEPNLKFLTGTSCILLIFSGSYVGKEYHIRTFWEILEVGGGLVDPAIF